jgi:hypothetical protein
MKGLLIILAMSFVMSAHADADHFQEHFRTQRINGKLVSIHMKGMRTNFSLKPYINHIKKSLISEQNRMRSKGMNYDKEIENMMFEDFERNFHNKSLSPNRRNSTGVRFVSRSMRKLSRLKVNGIFNNGKFKNVMGTFEEKLKKAFAYVDPSVLARLDDSKFFFKRKVASTVADQAIKIAKKKLSTIPLLNTASYVISQVQRMIVSRVTFRQNEMLHFLEKYPAADLGLTMEEVNLIMSSVYESRLALVNFIESKKAKQGWDDYGINTFYQYVRAANFNLKRYTPHMNKANARINFAFISADVAGESAILNLMDKDHQFSKKQAVSYFYNKPSKIFRKRSLLQLAELGMSFISLPNIIKSPLEGYLKSFYEKQRLTEGALYGYFVDNNMTTHMNAVLLQNVNPYELMPVK